MENVADAGKWQGKKPFVKPELVVLDVRGTQSGPFPDPNEFDFILQES